MVTQAREGIVWELLAVAQPFTGRGVDVQWVGIGMGRTLAERCQEASASGGDCCGISGNALE